MNPRTALRPLFLLFLLFLPVLAPAAAQDAPLAPDRREKIERLISSEMSRQGIPGLSAAVVTDHLLRWAAGFGFADMENHVPARVYTVYRLASISKPITAVAALQLWEEDRLDLDAPVQKYVPSFPEKEWPVTCRQLLGHLGGVRHYRGDEVASTRRYESLAQALSIFKDDPLVHQPGTAYHYTTYGYNLAGSAVEGASGRPFVEYVQERIFRPARMERIRADDAAALIPGRAQGYRRLPGGELRNSILADTSNKVPGGGFCGTVEDLARFAIAVHEDRLLKPETRRMMLTEQRTTGGKGTGYGLGWGLGERDGRREAFHGGGQPRVATFLYTLPDERCAVALMTNLEGARLPDLARRIADTALGRE